MAFMPTLLIAKHPGAGRNSRRARRLFHCGVLLSSMAVAGWAAGAEAPARPRAAKSPPRAEKGNAGPEFYEVFGKRYKVRESSNGYRERGIASWYGRPFHGRPTSSGEMYDMEEMTAAHTSLPLPTWVEVTNLSNGKTVVVKVNDRGPFVANRLIDLSYAAAKALDIVGSGTSRVEVRALDARPPEWMARAPNPAPRQPSARAATPAPAAAPAARATPPAALVASAAPPPPAPTEDERLFAQAGKFKKRSDAAELVAELKAQGLVNAFIVTEDGRRDSTHRVRVGPLPDDTAVKRMNDRLRDLGAKRSRSIVMN